MPINRQEVEAMIEESAETSIRLGVSIPVNLHGADLSGADLSGLDLSGANLHGANLDHANLTGAILKEANLHKADLTGATMVDAVVDGANLCGVMLKDADMTDSTLKKANLSEILCSNTAGLDLDGDQVEGANTFKAADTNTAYKLSTRKLRCCNACIGHATNKRFLSPGDVVRAHHGCDCEIKKVDMTDDEYGEWFSDGRRVFDLRE